MASSRSEKMLAAIGIRLQRVDRNCDVWKTVQETTEETVREPQMESSASDFKPAEIDSNNMASKEECSLEANSGYDSCKSSPKRANHQDKAENTDYLLNTPTTSAVLNDIGMSKAIEKEENGVIDSNKDTNIGCSSLTQSFSSSSSSSDSSDSIASDFSSDDSVKDPNFEQCTSSSSDSEEEVQTNSLKKYHNEVMETETNLTLSESVGLECKKKTRKRMRQPSTWDKNCTKRLRNSGKSYKTYKNRNEVPARSIKPPCDYEKCKQKCTSKFTEQERLTLFDNYWAMGNIVKQRTYIVTLMQDVNPTKEKHRINNHAFHFFKNGTKVRVCKPFFISTLGITNRCIRTVIAKKQEFTLADDLRGKHKNHKQVPQDIKDGIRAHISSIPTIESHYIRDHSEKVYIEGGKTIAQLYRDYKADCQRENKPSAKFSLYRNIFNYEFNIAFFIPKKDQCQTCVSYYNLGDDERKNAEEAFARHQEEKNLSREEKNRDKGMICPDYQVVCYDLQAALPTPTGQVSSFYYKSKLSTYNFTVCHLEKKGQGCVYCYMWHEGEGKRGAIEIGSCLLRFLEESAQKANSENLEIVFYSDNCAGQQKNKFVLSIFLYAVTNYKIKSITQKYLVTGHTQNEGDNVHSLIEKNIKRALKSGPIYTPAQYVMLVATAKKSGQPFKVIEFTHDDFVDLKKLTENPFMNFNTNLDGHTFKFSDISIFRVEKAHPNLFFYKTSYKDADFKMVSIIKEKRTRNNNSAPPLNFEGFEFEKAYRDKIPISKKKFEDLMFLVRSNAIIKNHSDFYNNLAFAEN